MTEAGSPGATGRVPTEDELVAYIERLDQPVSRRELARAFGIKGDQRVLLKERLKELMDAGRIERTAAKEYTVPAGLPAVTVLEVTGADLDGETVARPATWDRSDAPPTIYVVTTRGHPDPESGQRILARLSRQEDGSYIARILRRLSAPPQRILGTLERIRGGFALTPTDKRNRHEYFVPDAQAGEAQDGELVLAQPQPGGRSRRRGEVAILERLGDVSHPRAISLIAIHSHGIPTEFPQAALDEAERGKVPPLKGRTDLRHLPLVTIDGADARDFDDAVFAEPDPHRPGGWHLVVAIADVAYYVRPDSALDAAAYERGNSVYFPDRVVPMLPERLSNGLCSLNPGVNRACLAFHLHIDSEGNLRRHRLVRGIMRSRARLTYEQVQQARDGTPDATCAELKDRVIDPLFQAFEALYRNRSQRGTLDLDIAENEVVLGADGAVAEVVPRKRLTAHRVIEEFMICANVAAAQALEARNAPCVYRVHDQPDPLKLESLADFADSLGLGFSRRQQTQPRNFTKLLEQGEALGIDHLLTKIVLRTQSQAAYSPENMGHFGLALAKYAHFTSPIRRYADLLVHRALIRAYGLGDGGLPEGAEENFGPWCEHISHTERRGEQAERDAMDRYLAHYLSDKTGAIFQGHIGGVTRFGLFVTLDALGADGLVPIKSLPDDYYIHDDQRHALVGERWGRIYRLGAPVRVRLVEANPLSGSTLFDVLDTEGADIPALAEELGSAEETLAHARGQRGAPGSGEKPGGKPGKGGKKPGKKAPKRASGDPGAKSEPPAKAGTSKRGKTKATKADKNQHKRKSRREPS